MLSSNVTESNIGQIVVTAGHITVDWASRHDAPKQLTAGVRLILKDIKSNLGFFYHDAFGVIAFPVSGVDFYER
jgi:hypothetical protein